MPDQKFTHYDLPKIPSSVLREEHIEYGFIGKQRKKDGIQTYNERFEPLRNKLMVFIKAAPSAAWSRCQAEKFPTL